MCTILLPPLACDFSGYCLWYQQCILHVWVYCSSQSAGEVLCKSLVYNVSDRYIELWRFYCAWTWPYIYYFLMKYMWHLFFGWVLRKSIFVQAERQAVNTTVQGSAADIVKTATVNIQRRLEALSSVNKSHGHLENSFQRDKTGILTSSLHSKVKLLVIVMRKK